MDQQHSAHPSIDHPRLVRVPAGPGRNAYLPLLFLADDSEVAVRGYVQQGDLYVLHGDDETPIGVVLVIDEANGVVELKNVAVDAAHHGRGIGTAMVGAVLADLRAQGVARVIVGTASSSIGPLAFYQKAGFRPARVERDYFTAARGYSSGLEENGIPVRDMVWLDLEL